MGLDRVITKFINLKEGGTLRRLVDRRGYWNKNPSIPMSADLRISQYDKRLKDALLMIRQADRNKRLTDRRLALIYTDPVSGKVVAMSGRGARKAMDSWTQLATILSPEEMNQFLEAEETEDEENNDACAAMEIGTKGPPTRTGSLAEKLDQPRHQNQTAMSATN